MSRHPDLRLKVFAVWEPILVTDWKRPGKSVAARMTDSRVRQFWDSGHLIAKQLAGDARDPQPKPECCTRRGILWDVIAVYPPDVVWTGTMPLAALFDGPVVDQQADIEAALRKWPR